LTGLEVRTTAKPSLSHAGVEVPVSREGIEPSRVRREDADDLAAFVRVDRGVVEDRGDMAVAVPDAYFSLAQGRYGIGPALGLTFGVPVLGRKRLADMALTGRRVGAAEAERWGLINSVAQRSLETEVEELAEHVSETPPTLIRAMKEVLLRQMTLAGYESAFSYFAMFSQSQEAKAGTQRFLAKNK
jgi:enoyl-CoA hydratase/carnithine racemase